MSASMLAETRNANQDIRDIDFIPNSPNIPTDRSVIPENRVDFGFASQVIQQSPRPAGCTCCRTTLEPVLPTDKTTRKTRNHKNSRDTHRRTARGTLQEEKMNLIDSRELLPITRQVATTAPSRREHKPHCSHAVFEKTCHGHEETGRSKQRSPRRCAGMTRRRTMKPVRHPNFRRDPSEYFLR
jgi:hypothetical protein